MQGSFSRPLSKKLEATTILTRVKDRGISNALFPNSVDVYSRLSDITPIALMLFSSVELKPVPYYAGAQSLNYHFIESQLVNFIFASNLVLH